MNGLRFSSSNVRRQAFAAITASLLAACPPGATAQSADAPAATAIATDRNYEVSFRELGATFPLQLRGVDGRNGVPFSVRADQVVTGARLHMQYSYSPALLANISHLNVLINEEVVSSLPVPNAEGGKLLQRTIDIPPHLITDFNRANIQLIGHYTLECEDPLHSSLWSVVSNESVLELNVAPILLENDLGLLPLPFFDRRDVKQLEVPFVLEPNAGTAQLEAAGVLASWFGAMASYRGATFPVSLGQLPARGNAVVFVTGNQSIPGVTLPQRRGPALAITSNPNDRYGKLLVVMGNDAAELKLAATALAVGTQAFSGSVSEITHFADLAPRKPYDAPNWLRSDRPVSFGELASADSLTVSGYSPDLIRIPLRLPPDLFGWRQPGIPVTLNYRYTPRPTADKSTLNINLGNQFLQSIPLPSVAPHVGNTTQQLVRRFQSDPTPATTRFRIPLYALSSQSLLTFHYYYDYIRQGECRDVIIDNVRGTIDPDSTIDISNIPHFIEMPNLAAFATSGFPFTRMADLSETTVVLPDSPTPVDYEVFLNLMGRMGESTGYPTTGVRVALPNATDLMADRDLLILASGDNQSLLKQWANHLPFSLHDDDKRYTLSDRVFRMFSWLDPDQRNSAELDRIDLAVRNAGTDAVLAGFESPLTSRRSVIVFSSNRPEGLSRAVEALVSQDADVIGNIQGSLVVMRGDKVDTLAARQTYTTGRLNPIVHAQYYLAYRPILLVIIGVSGAILLAAFFFYLLQARARRRLDP